MERFMKTIEVKYEQESDGNADDSSNYMTVKADDCGGGAYIVLETERWALNPDEIDKFCAELKQLIAECE